MRRALGLAAALSASLLALDLGFQAGRDIGAVDLASPTHLEFHLTVAAGVAYGAAAVLLVLAWWPVRRGEPWGVAALALFGLAAAIGVVPALLVEWRGAQLYDHAHSSVAALVPLWALAVACGTLGLRRKAR